MEENNKQFVTVPTKELKDRGLNMKDIVIYAYLRRHYNHTTKEAFPSLDTLAKESGISKPTVIKCLDNLVRANYIQIKQKGKPNHYTFSDINKFEIYSFDFLDDKTLTTNDKAYMICIQPHMFKNAETGTGSVVYSELDIANKLGIDLRTLHKYEKHLQQYDKQILTLVPTAKKDPVTGLAIQERIFDFEAYNNILALKFLEVDEELKKKADTERVVKLETENKEMKQEITEIKRVLKLFNINIEDIKAKAEIIV